MTAREKIHNHVGAIVVKIRSVIIPIVAYAIGLLLLSLPSAINELFYIRFIYEDIYAIICFVLFTAFFITYITMRAIKKKFIKDGLGSIILIICFIFSVLVRAQGLKPADSRIFYSPNLNNAIVAIDRTSYDHLHHSYVYKLKYDMFVDTNSKILCVDVSANEFASGDYFTWQDENICSIDSSIIYFYTEKEIKTRNFNEIISSHIKLKEGEIFYFVFEE